MAGPGTPAAAVAAITARFVMFLIHAPTVQVVASSDEEDVALLEATCFRFARIGYAWSALPLSTPRLMFNAQDAAALSGDVVVSIPFDRTQSSA